MVLYITITLRHQMQLLEESPVPSGGEGANCGPNRRLRRNARPTAGNPTRRVIWSCGIPNSRYVTAKRGLARHAGADGPADAGRARTPAWLRNRPTNRTDQR